MDAEASATPAAAPAASWRNPRTVLAHMLFRVAAALMYLLCAWFSDSFVTQFVVIAVLLSCV